MRLAIISDIHGNLEALGAVLHQCESLQVKRTVCLGDLVGYGPDPAGCVEAIQNVSQTVLIGNHDHAAVSLPEARHFNPIAKIAIRWTSEILQKDHLDYLRELPLIVEESDVLFVHSSPSRPETWPYLFSPVEGRRDLAYTDAKFCFVGHSHHAFICSNEGGDVVGEGTVSISGSERYLTNVGSVGQPRDADPRASFAVWDQDAEELQLHRVAYDVSATQKKIRNLQLPELLAERLATGR
jgi:diadenosine tetraphosphatase ApaH/serine/threonine PP2A family protein phosphatase